MKTFFQLTCTQVCWLYFSVMTGGDGVWVPVIIILLSGGNGFWVGSCYYDQNCWGRGVLGWVGDIRGWLVDTFSSSSRCYLVYCFFSLFFWTLGSVFGLYLSLHTQTGYRRYEEVLGFVCVLGINTNPGVIRLDWFGRLFFRRYPNLQSTPKPKPLGHRNWSCLANYFCLCYCGDMVGMGWDRYNRWTPQKRIFMFCWWLMFRRCTMVIHLDLGLLFVLKPKAAKSWIHQWKKKDCLNDFCTPHWLKISSLCRYNSNLKSAAILGCLPWAVYSRNLNWSWAYVFWLWNWFFAHVLSVFSCCCWSPSCSSLGTGQWQWKTAAKLGHHFRFCRRHGSFGVGIVCGLWIAKGAPKNADMFDKIDLCCFLSVPIRIMESDFKICFRCLVQLEVHIQFQGDWACRGFLVKKSVGFTVVGYPILGSYCLDPEIDHAGFGLRVQQDGYTGSSVLALLMGSAKGLEVILTGLGLCWTWLWKAFQPFGLLVHKVCWAGLANIFVGLCRCFLGPGSRKILNVHSGCIPISHGSRGWHNGCPYGIFRYHSFWYLLPYKNRHFCKVFQQSQLG
ncbi:hypothetical protein Hanom_Chr02g00095261 [Helianthus anomalus]